MGAVRRSSEPRSLFALPIVASTSGRSAPVFSTALASTYSAAMVIGAGLENPCSASAGVTIPAARTATIAPSMAPAAGMASRTSRTMTITTTARVNQASQLIGLSPTWSRHRHSLATPSGG